MATCFHLAILLGFVHHGDGNSMFVPLKYQLTFSELHGVMSQKIALVTTATVRTCDVSPYQIRIMVSLL
jgi:hypothetical protein